MNLTIAINARALRVGSLVLAGAALLGFAAVSSAHSGPVASGVIHGCVNDVSSSADAPAGMLRIVDANATCKSNEHPVDWNAQGIQGPQGPSGVATLTIRTKSMSFTAGYTAGTVLCNPGERATGGGFNTFFTDVDVKVKTSEPYPFIGTPTGWSVGVFNPSSTSAVVEAWVVCASG